MHSGSYCRTDCVGRFNFNCCATIFVCIVMRVLFAITASMPRKAIVAEKLIAASPSISPLVGPTAGLAPSKRLAGQREAPLSWLQTLNAIRLIVTHVTDER